MPTDKAPVRELIEAALAAGPTEGEWSVPHYSRDDVKCDCTSVLSETCCGAIATIHFDDGRGVTEGGGYDPIPSEAKANGKLIAACCPANIRQLLSEHDASIAAERARGDRLEAAVKQVYGMHHDLIVVMQAAWIAWQRGNKDANAAMLWIENTLDGPGLIPDADEPYSDDPQAYFDKNRMEPYPECFCGKPSNQLWMGKGFCSETHYDEHRAALAVSVDALDDEQMDELIRRLGGEWAAPYGDLYAAMLTAAPSHLAVCAGGSVTQPASDEMDSVAIRYAHSLALELETVLSACDGTHWDKAIQVLGDYRSAMSRIHERESPTFMGEPLIQEKSK